MGALAQRPELRRLVGPARWGSPRRKGPPAHFGEQAVHFAFCSGWGQPAGRVGARRGALVREISPVAYRAPPGRPGELGTTLRRLLGRGTVKPTYFALIGVPFVLSRTSSSGANTSLKGVNAPG